MLSKFSDAIRTDLSKLDRSKIVALVTIEVRNDQVPCAGAKLGSLGCNYNMS